MQPDREDDRSCSRGTRARGGGKLRGIAERVEVRFRGKGNLLRLFIVPIFLIVTACNRPEASDWKNFGGHAERGALVIAHAGCGQCHVIPGIADAVGKSGPPLTGFGPHTTVAGLLPNTAESLTHWIRDPQSVLPGNVMPDLGLTEQQARDIAAYLHTLR